MNDYSGGYSDFGGGGYRGGGGGGGGFMTGYSPSSSGADRKPGGGRTSVGRNIPVVPITASALEGLQAPELRIGDHEIKLVSLVGVVSSVERGSLWYDYQLTDSSSPHPVQIRQWLNNDDNTSTESAMEGSTVHVYGHIKEYDGIVRIFSTSIRPVAPEVAALEQKAHELEAQLAQLFYSKDMPNRLQQTGGHETSSTSFSAQRTLDFSSSRSAAPSSSASAGKSIVDQIYEVVRSAAVGDHSGIAVEEIHKRIPRVSLQQLRTHLEELCNEGHMYTTIDEDHFQCTDGAL